MYIIKTLADIHRLQESQSISGDLVRHLQNKLAALQMALEPDTDLEQFSLAIHGPIGLLEKGDRNLAAIGLPESLDEIMPEWVSRVEVAGGIHYVLYVMADNDYMMQVYLPDAILEEEMRLWLLEQSIEEESGDCSYGTVEPF